MDGLFKDVEGFEWDEGNKEKNWKKHGITNKETEEVFLDSRLIAGKDEKHSTIEPRYQLYGRSRSSRYLAVVFTFRSKKIRIISARLMNRKERKKYDKEKSKKQN